jgi:hypothetical protein
VTPPSLERIKADGFFDDDVELVPEDQAVMHISPEAVTVISCQSWTVLYNHQADSSAISYDYISRAAGRFGERQAGFADHGGKWWMSWISRQAQPNGGAECG